MLNLFNSLSGKLESFTLLKNKEVKMYTCGPSTYMAPHVGNYRTFLYEDILQRYLEYLGFNVTRLMTLTDVEDKAIAEAKKEKISVEELTTRNENLLFRDFSFLNIKVPSFMVRASTVVNQAARMVKFLVEKGYAYWHSHKGAENVYFDPTKFVGFGKLAKLNMKQWPKRKRRFHQDTYPGTPWNKGDFILWHGCRDNDVCWETEIGRGRPAWNIQDAAIVTQNLGFEVDIAAGGIDNLVRHHDYTIAVSEAFSGRQLARYWLHGAHLFVDGQKMSKSKGNFYYPRDFESRGFRGDQIRFFLIYENYRKKLDFTWEGLTLTSQKLAKFKNMVENLKKADSVSSSPKAKPLVARIISSFEANMNFDLSVKAAFDELFVIVERIHRLMVADGLSRKDAKAAIRSLKHVDSVIKIMF